MSFWGGSGRGMGDHSGIFQKAWGGKRRVWAMALEHLGIFQRRQPACRWAEWLLIATKARENEALSVFFNKISTLYSIFPATVELTKQINECVVTRLRHGEAKKLGLWQRAHRIWFQWARKQSSHFRTLSPRNSTDHWWSGHVWGLGNVVKTLYQHFV